MSEHDEEPGKDEENGRFLPGNRFWEARSSAGPRPKFKTARQLEKRCIEYFEWNEENPLYEAKAFSNGLVRNLPKMRALTLKGLCLFLRIGEQTWRDWRDKDGDHYRPDLAETIAWVEAIIYRQKFEGAAAELLSGTIISRDLGLADKKEIEGNLKVKTLADFYGGSDPADAEPGSS